MWYPSITTVAAAEVVTIDLARQQARTEQGDGHDGELNRLITVARGFVERYCGIRIGSQTFTAKCDCFDDLARLPEAPINSVSSIGYVDGDGANQTLAGSVYEVRLDGLEGGIVLKYGQMWPSTQAGSRITLTAVAGYDGTQQSDLIQAMLLLIGDWFTSHETMQEGRIAPLPYAVEALLTNFRRNA